MGGDKVLMALVRACLRPRASPISGGLYRRSECGAHCLDLFRQHAHGREERTYTFTWFQPEWVRGAQVERLRS